MMILFRNMYKAYVFCIKIGKFIHHFNSETTTKKKRTKITKRKRGRDEGGSGKAVFGTLSFQHSPFIFCAHAFQTIKWCVFFKKKFLYEVA